ncbi:hypothetical protein [Synechococcus sp. CBW1107]|uniref:hypothetical protein n=1 Tax=Synechococcus sp. CBW1107 TaxID=2789857 RepID=UPI002AD4579C|nr:hypothetical protein [Synechococcus sp. CBW1107]CAK6698840.1 hypothetical protein ICNINCKA_02520 [Synechococcus sp. CBW1107]
MNYQEHLAGLHLDRYLSQGSGASTSSLSTSRLTIEISEELYRWMHGLPRMYRHPSAQFLGNLIEQLIRDDWDRFKQYAKSDLVSQIQLIDEMSSAPGCNKST